MGLVDKSLAIQHVKAEVGIEDDLIQLYLDAAEQSAQDYLNRQVFADQDALNAAVIAGTAGVEPMVVDSAVKAAILLTFGHLYANREDVVIGTSAIALPNGAQALLRPKRLNMGP